jgi:hypothetical protein
MQDVPGSSDDSEELLDSSEASEDSLDVEAGEASVEPDAEEKWYLAIVKAMVKRGSIVAPSGRFTAPDALPLDAAVATFSAPPNRFQDPIPRGHLQALTVHRLYSLAWFLKRDLQVMQKLSNPAIAARFRDFAVQQIAHKMMTFAEAIVGFYGREESRRHQAKVRFQSLAPDLMAGGMDSEDRLAAAVSKKANLAALVQAEKKYILRQMEQSGSAHLYAGEPRSSRASAHGGGRGARSDGAQGSWPRRRNFGPSAASGASSGAAGVAGGARRPSVAPK